MHPTRPLFCLSLYIHLSSSSHHIYLPQAFPTTLLRHQRGVREYNTFITIPLYTCPQPPRTRIYHTHHYRPSLFLLLSSLQSGFGRAFRKGGREVDWNAKQWRRRSKKRTKRRNEMMKMKIILPMRERERERERERA